MRELTIYEFEDVNGGLVFLAPLAPFAIAAAKWTAVAVAASFAATVVVAAADGAVDAASGAPRDSGNGG